MEYPNIVIYPGIVIQIAAALEKSTTTKISL
jgi:hypothetical protein